MGPRFPAGISRAEKAAETLPGRAGNGAHGDRDRAGQDRHRQATATAGTPLLRRQLQPAKSDLSYRTQIGSLRATARLHSEPGKRERDRLLREQKRRGLARGSVVRRWHQRKTVSRGADDQRTHPKSGTFSSG